MSRSRLGSLGPRPVRQTLDPDLRIYLQFKVQALESLGPRPVGRTLGPDLIIYLYFKVRGLDLRTRPYNISVIQGLRSRSKVRIQGPGPDLEA